MYLLGQKKKNKTTQNQKQITNPKTQTCFASQGNWLTAWLAQLSRDRKKQTRTFWLLFFAKSPSNYSKQLEGFSVVITDILWAPHLCGFVTQ